MAGRARARAPESGVVLRSGLTGSTFLRRALAVATRRSSGGPRLSLPEDDRRFKALLGEIVAEVEAGRIASPHRMSIARDVVLEAEKLVVFRTPGGRETSLRARLDAAAEPLPIVEVASGSGTALVPRVRYGGHDYEGAGVVELVGRLWDGDQLTAAACRSLAWVVAKAGRGELSLAGRRFALLGAGAEISPVRTLLEAGASVLWLDVKPPPADLAAARFSGTLAHAPGADLLRAPDRVKATIEAFAGDESIHLGCYAYAPGGSRELRLVLAMNAIARALGADRVASASLLVSPTTPPVLQPEDVTAARQRRQDAPLWQRALEHAGVLGPGHFRSGPVTVARTVVPIQGASYQAAQYVGKILMAEAMSAYGLGLHAGAPSATRVSANVAPITRTRSLSHPLFRMAFRGAPRFGVETFAPETTRALMGLLTLHDVCNERAPAAPGESSVAGRVAAMRSQQVHGGIFAVPYRLDTAIATAAVVGSMPLPRSSVSGPRVPARARLWRLRGSLG